MPTWDDENLNAPHTQREMGEDPCFYRGAEPLQFRDEHAPPPSVTFTVDELEFFRVNGDGTIWRNPDFKGDDAAQEVWAAALALAATYNETVRSMEGL